MIKCEICKKDFKKIRTHLTVSHKTNAKEYYDKFIRRQNEGFCITCGEETTFISFTKGYLRACSSRCASLFQFKELKRKESLLSEEERQEKILARSRKQSERTKKLWQNEAFREKMKKVSSRTMTATNKKMWESSDHRGRMLKNHARHLLDPCFREKINEGLRSDKNRARCSKRMKGKWKDASYQEKMIPILRKNYTGEGINKSEQKLFNLLKSFDECFEYTGDGSKPIALKWPDFINENKKCIVELYGTYWHRDETEEQTNNRIDLFKACGYRTLIVWDSELKDLDRLKIKINEFCNAASQ